MALSLLFDFIRGKRNSMIGTLELDAMISETHEIQNDISQFPIEDGGNISDHFQRNPRRITIEGFVTNTPVKLFGVLDLSGFTSPFEDNVQMALEYLEKISGRPKNIDQSYPDPELVTIVTGLKVYQNMMIERLTIPRDRTTGQALRFLCELVEVRTVNSQTVQIPGAQLPEDDDEILDHAESVQDLGRQIPPTSEESTEERVSILADWFN